MKVLIVTESQASAISDALERILADSPEVVFGSYGKREQSVKWRNVENAANALANAETIKPTEKVCLLTNSEASGLYLAAGNILQACDNKEIRDFFGNSASASAAWRGFEKLQKLFRG